MYLLNFSKYFKEKHKKSKEKNLAVFTPKPCEMCGKHLCSQRSAKIHYRMKHTGERIGFGCRLCSERFDTIEKRYTFNLNKLF